MDKANNRMKAIKSENAKIKCLAALLDCSDIKKINENALHLYCEVIIDISTKISGYTSDFSEKNSEIA